MISISISLPQDGVRHEAKGERGRTKTACHPYHVISHKSDQCRHQSGAASDQGTDDCDTKDRVEAPRLSRHTYLHPLHIDTIQDLVLLLIDIAEHCERILDTMWHIQHLVLSAIAVTGRLHARHLHRCDDRQVDTSNHEYG